MTKFKKILKKISLIAKGRSDLAFKRKKLRDLRSSNHDGTSKIEQSQSGQDDWVLKFFESDPTNKIFVEFGAHDGTTNSNTFRLEKEFGWDGLLIEPIPSAFENLEKVRTCRCLNACISGAPGTVHFMEVTGQACQLSGIFSDFPKRHIKRIDEAISLQGGKKIMHEIRALTLEQALNDARYERVDFLSIDTEGSEFDILKEFPFHKFKIKIIAVENTYHGDYLIDLMESKGFTLVEVLGCDEIYVSNRCLSSPMN